MLRWFPSARSCVAKLPMLGGGVVRERPIRVLPILALVNQTANDGAANHFQPSLQQPTEVKAGLNYKFPSGFLVW
jgi:hypothetical protein